MTDNDWTALIETQRERLVGLEAQREEAIGNLADAAPGVREQVLGRIDSQIVDARTAIDNFEWMRNRS